LLIESKEGSSRRSKFKIPFPPLPGKRDWLPLQPLPIPVIGRGNANQPLEVPTEVKLVVIPYLPRDLLHGILALRKAALGMVNALMANPINWAFAHYFLKGANKVTGTHPGHGAQFSNSQRQMMIDPHPLHRSAHVFRNMLWVFVGFGTLQGKEQQGDQPRHLCVNMESEARLRILEELKDTLKE